MNEDYTQPFYVPLGKGKLNLHTGQRGGYYLPALELAEEKLGARAPTSEPEWTNRQWDKVKQMENELIGWREKHAKALLEIDKLRAKVDRTNKKYKSYK